MKQIKLIAMREGAQKKHPLLSECPTNSLQETISEIAERECVRTAGCERIFEVGRQSRVGVLEDTTKIAHMQIHLQK